MGCPTCDHTMQNLGLDTAGRRSFWCSRCGTVKTEFDGTFTDDFGTQSRQTISEHEAPFLVKRCREFEKWCKEGIGWGNTNHYKQWLGLGLPEAINIPADRPKE